MYSYDRTAYTTPGSYDKMMQRLVTVVDKMQGGTKHMNMAQRLADDIANVAAGDPAVVEQEKKTGLLYGINQNVGLLKKALRAYQTASDDIGHYYDELNKQLLRNRLR